MQFSLPALVFITTNLWGLFGEIPFTAIQPSRPLLDRAVGCLQLASTVYTLEQIQPYFSQTGAVLLRGSTETSTAQTWGANATSQREPASIAATLTPSSDESDPFPTSWAAFPVAIDLSTRVYSWSTRLSGYSDAFSDRLASLFGGPQQPEARRDTQFENLVLVLLVLIFSILIKQTMQAPDTTRELECLRGEVATVRDLNFLNTTISQRTHALDEKLQAVQTVIYQQQVEMNQAGQYLQGIHSGTRELLKPCLDAMQANTTVVMDAIDSIHDVQNSFGRAVQDLRTTIDLATDMWWTIAIQLTQYPGELCDQLARTVANVLSAHLNESSTTDTMDDASNSGLENGDGV